MSIFGSPTPTSVEPSRLLDLLKRYIDIFGDKATCYEDLRPYADLHSDILSDWIAFLEGIPHIPVSFPGCHYSSANAYQVLKCFSSEIY
jgi:hypothetical protein